MSLSEADTKAKLIDPALHRRGWTEDLIRREETECGIDILDGSQQRRERGRIDSGPISEIRKIDGIGYAKAVQVKAALE